MSHEFVQRRFGEHDWQHKIMLAQYVADGETEDVELTVRTWPLGNLGFLTTWSSSEDVVMLYGLATRSRWFDPRIGVGPDHTIRLGRSHLSDLPAPGNRFAAVGARRFGYAETHYFGNPGGYRTWIVGVSDAGYNPRPPTGVRDDDTDVWLDDQLAQYCRTAVINSVVICGLGTLQVDSDTFLPYGVGPDLDTVRLQLTDSQPSAWTRWRQQRRDRLTS